MTSGVGAELAHWVREGLDDEGLEALSEALDGPPGDGDEALAQRLYAAMHERRMQEFLCTPDAAEPRAEVEAGAADEGAADSSYLGQLGLGEAGSSLAQLDDPKTLVAVLHAGALRQRRASIRILGQVLGEGKKVTGPEAKEAVGALQEARDVEVMYERVHAFAHQSGSLGRSARAELERMQKVGERLTEEVRKYWDSASRAEPIAELTVASRAEVLAYCRDMPDALVTHLGALLEGSDGSWTVAARVDLAASLRYAADSRLVPSLRSLLFDSEGELVLHAAHALGRIDDPRVRPALVRAYPRVVRPVAKAAVAGALAAHGDFRGRDYVVALLETSDVGELLAGVDALQVLGEAADLGRLVPLMKHEDAQVIFGAIRALGRIGDARAHAFLGAMVRENESPAVRAHALEAARAIQHRLELRGEEPHESALVPEDLERESEGDEASVRFWIRLLSRFDYLVGLLWVALGSMTRGTARFEQAAARRTGWALPLISLGSALQRRSEYGGALAVYRRALETNRRRLEQNPGTISRVASTFLMRAEELQRDGRDDIALGLLEEANSLDLRRARSAMRFELRRQLERLRGRHDA